MQPRICDLCVRLDIYYTIHRMLLWSCGKTVAREVIHCSSSMQKLKKTLNFLCVCLHKILTSSTKKSLCLIYAAKAM